MQNTSTDFIKRPYESTPRINKFADILFRLKNSAEILSCDRNPLFPDHKRRTLIELDSGTILLSYSKNEHADHKDFRRKGRIENFQLRCY